MKGVPTTRNGGAKAIKGTARNMYGLSQGKTPFKGTSCLSIPTPKGK
jgi:hypothetical protein